MRVAQPADFPAVRSFYDELIDDLLTRPHHPMWSRDGHPADDYLRDAIDGGELWLAELGGEIAGAMVVNHAANDGYKGVPWQVQAEPEQVVIVHAFGVSSRHQGKGLGKAFVKYPVNEILDKQVGQPFLFCLGVNKKARQLYDSLGFQEVTCNAYATKQIS